MIVEGTLPSLITATQYYITASAAAAAASDDDDDDDEDDYDLSNRTTFH